MHEGEWSSRLGIPAQPGLAEEEMLARDLRLVRLTGSPMHFLHLSTATSIALIAAAKAEGLPVTAEVTPHHLCLTDAEVASFDARFKVNPPLRTEHDVDAVRAGVASGAIDAIATDHAPHPAEEKDAPFEEAPFGMIGLETALCAAYGALVAGGPRISPSALWGAMSTRPARTAHPHISSSSIPTNASSSTRPTARAGVRTPRLPVGPSPERCARRSSADVSSSTAGSSSDPPATDR
jgi:dihydroorotase